MNETTKLLFTSGLAFFTSIVAAYITTIITVQLSLRRFRSEKWWERKAEIYSQLLNFLYDLKQDSTIEFSIEQPSEEERREFKSRTKKASDEIQRIRTLGAFIISEKVWDLLNEMEMRRRINLNDPINTFFSIVQEDERIFSIYLPKLREQIRKDLKVSD